MNALVESTAWSIAGWSLLHYLWIGAAIGLTAWPLRRIVCRLPPQARYAIALLFLVALALAPAFIAWRFAAAWPESAPVVISSLPTEAPAIKQSLAAPPAAESTRNDQAAPPIASAVAPPVESIEATVTRYLHTGTSLAARWAPAVWLIGMPLTLGLLATGLAGAERLRRHSEPLAAGPIVDAMQRWAEALRVSRTVAVRVTDRVVAPMVIGILRPTILLPAAVATGHSSEQIEMILLHELAHIRRGDNFVNLLQRVVEAVLFFQPAVWIVSRWVRLEREHCCDATVLGYTGDPQGYAETLASLAMPGVSPAYAAAAMANHQLVTRIQHILSVEEQTISISGRVLAFAGATAIAATLLVAGYAQSNAANAEQQSVDELKSVEPASMMLMNQLLARGLKVPDADVDDATYLRRLSLDLRGTPPTADETKAFVASRLSDKRSRIIRKLLEQPAEVKSHLEMFQGGVPGRDFTWYIGQLNEAAATTPRAWGPEQATGAPNVTTAGDNTAAWASLTQDDQDEWLELEYAEPVDAIAVLVHANDNPGAIRGVTIYDAQRVGLQYTWTGDDPTQRDAGRGLSLISLSVRLKVNKVRLDIASKSVSGWNEIDAVGLLDANGKTHWATDARASSTYADRGTAANRLALDVTRSEEAKLAADLVAQQYERSASRATIDVLNAGVNTEAAKRGWNAEQATGAPNSVMGSDDARAWASKTPDSQDEWLELTYGEAVNAVAVVVYESLAPGAVTTICAAAPGEDWVQVFSGDAKDDGDANRGRVLTAPLAKPQSVNRIYLYLSSPAVAGWNEIDAVGVLDRAGKMHWASAARASSTYADVTGGVGDVGDDLAGSIATGLDATRRKPSHGKPVIGLGINSDAGLSGDIVVHESDPEAAGATVPKGNGATGVRSVLRNVIESESRDYSDARLMELLHVHRAKASLDACMSCHADPKVAPQRDTATAGGDAGGGGNRTALQQGLSALRNKYPNEPAIVELIRQYEEDLAAIRKQLDELRAKSRNATRPAKPDDKTPSVPKPSSATAHPMLNPAGSGVGTMPTPTPQQALAKWLTQDSRDTKTVGAGDLLFDGIGEKFGGKTHGSQSPLRLEFQLALRTGEQHLFELPRKTRVARV